MVSGKKALLQDVFHLTHFKGRIESCPNWFFSFISSQHFYV